MTLRTALAFASLSLLSLAPLACVAEVSPPQDPALRVCGGAVCFEPRAVAVRHWGAGEVTVGAWRGESDACAIPQVGDKPSGGMMIEVRLNGATPGARLPIVSRTTHRNDDDRSATASVHALRIDGNSGRAMADEEAVSGDVTVLDIDETSGRVRVRVRARWSSGVHGELVLDVAERAVAEATCPATH